MPRQFLGRRRTDMADGQPNEHPPQRPLLRGSEVGEQLLRILSQLTVVTDEEPAVTQLVGVDGKHVAFVMH